MTNIHENIRLHREIKGFSQEYIADKLSMTQSAYAKLESGKITMSLDRLISVAEILETDTNSLLTGQSAIYYFQNKGVATAHQSAENIYNDSREVYD